MDWKKPVRRVFARCGLDIRRRDAVSVALVDPFLEQKRLVKQAYTIFDVGAYTGEVSKIYCNLFPDSTVYAFEPFLDSFAKLKNNVQLYPNVHVFNLGLTDRQGLLPFHNNTFAPTNSLLEPHQAADSTWGPGVVKSKGLVYCTFTTLDEFVVENSISFIDILKLDVQGAEVQILDGAKQLVATRKIGLIYTEIIAMPTYRGQKCLWEVFKKFADIGMELHNLYNLDAVGRLRQFDAIFVPTR